ncbi:MAG: M16 family metallopeptidase, partial [Gemmatimonadota bacterium]
AETAKPVPVLVLRSSARPVDQGVLLRGETQAARRVELRAGRVGLRPLRMSDARAWHDEQVRRSPCVLAAVGDVEPAEAARLLSAAFGALEFREAAPFESPIWPGRVVQHVTTRDKAQTGLAIAFPSPARRDEDRVAAHLIAGVASGLGGRFFDELRDKQSLGYTDPATASDRLAAGMFLAYIGTSPEKEGAARDGLLREFARLCDAPVTDAELDRARTYALGIHAIAQQSGGNVLAQLVDAWLYGTGIEELDSVEERIRAVTPQAMRELARANFDPARRVEGIVRGKPAAG